MTRNVTAPQKKPVTPMKSAPQVLTNANAYQKEKKENNNLGVQFLSKDKSHFKKDRYINCNPELHLRRVK